MCKQSIEVMSDDGKEFDETLDKLQTDGLIEYIEGKKFIDHVPLQPDLLARISGSEYKEVERQYEGYLITRRGIIVYNKQVVIPFGKVLKNIDKIPKHTLSAYAKDIETLKNSADLANSVSDFIIKSAPYAIQFIKLVITGLAGLGIHDIFW